MVVKYMKYEKFYFNNYEITNQIHSFFDIKLYNANKYISNNNGVITALVGDVSFNTNFFTGI